MFFYQTSSALRSALAISILMLTILLTACGGGGLRYTRAPDGSWVKQTPENMRTLYASNWAEAVTSSSSSDFQHKSHQQLQGLIVDQYPVNTAIDQDELSNWVFDQPITITMYWRDLPADTSMSEAIVRKRAESKVEGHVTISFEHEVVAQAIATQAEKTQAEHQEERKEHNDKKQADPEATAISPITYQIQAGDTLATISSIFYGSHQHWRTIIEANPGLDPSQLTAGQKIIIPPLTTSSR